MSKLHALIAYTFSTLILMLLVVLTGCDDPNPRPEPMPVPQVGSCYEVFADVVTAYEVVEPVSAACKGVMADYTIELVDELPAGCSTAGCTLDYTIYIQDDLSAPEQVGIASHEWFAALNLCNDAGQAPPGSDPVLWKKRQEGTAEFHAYKYRAATSCVD